MFPDSSGNSNTAAGAGALLNNSTGKFNIAVGSSALQGAENTTGSSHTAIGYGAGASRVTGSNNLYVANSGEHTEFGVTRIGTAGSQTAANIAGIHWLSCDAPKHATNLKRTCNLVTYAIPSLRGALPTNNFDETKLSLHPHIHGCSVPTPHEFHGGLQ